MSTADTHQYDCVGRLCTCSPQLCQGRLGQCWNRATWQGEGRVYCGRHLRGVIGATKLRSP